MNKYYDVECPYCGNKQNINHDEGYGYEEDEVYEQECPECEKIFIYTTTISFSYDVSKADCLNGAEHKMEKVWQANPPLFPNWKRCKVCGYEGKGKIDKDAFAVMTGEMTKEEYTKLKSTKEK